MRHEDDESLPNRQSRQHFTTEISAAIADRGGGRCRGEYLAECGASRRVGAAAVATPGRMTIGCGTVVFRQLPLKEAQARIRRAGYEYIETQAVGPRCPHVDVAKDDPEAFRDLVRS